MHSRIIRRITVFFAASLLTTLLPCRVFADAGNAGDQETITGLGLASPARPNVSQDQRFRAYIWTDATRPFVQINDKDGHVLAVFIVTIDGAKSLGIGEASEMVRDNSNSQPFVRAVKNGTLAKCPCTATKVIDQGAFSVVVVLGSRDEVIAIHAINRTDET